jgi:uncharacterized protein YigE (DUF2233 family)
MSSVSKEIPRRLTPWLVAILLISLSLPACSLPILPPTPTPTPTVTPTPTATPSPTPEPADTGWEPVEPGVEVRQVRVPTGDVAERLLLIRIEPDRFRFRVRYTPGSGRRVSEWAAEVEPLLVVNGGYFTPEYEATGLVVSEGRVYGTSYEAFAGMFAVLPGGRVELRWLMTEPYDPEEMVVAAVQSFPVLVKPGGVMGFPPDADDGWPARRTVLALDEEGRLIFLVAPRGYLGLHDLARWLVESDLGVDVALNLDGGQSTGVVLAAEGRELTFDSLVPVPAVIVVERRP